MELLTELLKTYPVYPIVLLVGVWLGYMASDIIRDLRS